MKSLKVLFFLILLLNLNLYGWNDADLDGVDDAHDKCQNTPFSDLIDASGCSVVSLDLEAYYDFIIGYNYLTSNPNTLEDTKTTATTIQANIYKNNISIHFQSSYYESQGSSYSDRGYNDTQISLFYRINTMMPLNITVGGALILPTYTTGYNNEKIDYSASLLLEYSLQDNIDFFGGYSFTIVNDEDIKEVARYQNTNAYYLGFLYKSKKDLSLHASYSNSQSIYKKVTPIETMECGLIVQMNENWFTLIDYANGISESASEHEVSIRLGYSF